MNDTVALLLLLLPPATKLGQGYVFTRVCDSVHRGGLPQCILGYSPPRPEAGNPPPRTRPPGPEAGTPGPDTHPGTSPPPAQCMLGDNGNKRAVHILLECNLLGFFCSIILTHAGLPSAEPLFEQLNFVGTIE